MVFVLFRTAARADIRLRQEELATVLMQQS